MGNNLTQDQHVEILYKSLGRAITAFATIELLLCNHFALITQTQPAMAKAVFFFARSLRGRLDMIKDAVVAAGSVVSLPSYVPFIKVALNRVGQWAGTRNMLAHANIGFVDWQTSRYHGKAILWDSSTADWPDPKSALLLPDLENAAANFGRMSSLLMVAYSRGSIPNELALKECHALALQLPTLASAPETRPQFLRRMSKILPDGQYSHPLP